MTRNGIGPNPFPGLRPFEPAEADLFFGRDTQCDELVRRLTVRRFVAVVGTSGSGKSSLVRAGLIPSLEGGFSAAAGAHWHVVIIRPQDDPIGFLARGLVDVRVTQQTGVDPTAAVAVVDTTLRRSSLGLIEAVRLGRFAPYENLLVVVDQFEEVFRFADAAMDGEVVEDAPAFVNLLLEASGQTDVPIYVVITMRSDFLGDCARFRHLPEAINSSQYLIPRLTRDELYAAVTGPVRVRGGAIAADAVQHLLNAVGDDMDQLPVLQHALMRAWDHWRGAAVDGRPIDLDDLDAIGGMVHALSRHADEAFDTLTHGDRRLAERLFKCLTVRGPDKRELRRPASLSQLAEIAGSSNVDAVRVIETFRALGRSFLLPSSDVVLEDDSVIDISHESLIRQWHRLRDWVDEEVESRAAYLRLVEAARLHQAGKGGLWREPDLIYTRQWEQRQQPTVAWAALYAPGFDGAIAFLRASEAAQAAAHERERQREETERFARERELAQAQALAEAERHRAEEQARHAKRLRRLLWSAVAAGCVAVVLALAAIGLYINMRRARDASFQQRVIADVQRLALSSTTISFEYPQRALLLALQGVSMASAAALHVPDAEQALRDNLRAASGIAVDGVPGAFAPMAASANGRWIAVGAATGVIHLVDLSAASPGASVTLLRGHLGAVEAIAMSPDSRWLLTGGADRTARLWDLSGTRPPTSAILLEDHRDRVTVVAISADGRWVATGSADSVVRVWPLGRVDVSRGAVALRGHHSVISSLVFTPYGRLASASEDGEVRLWNLMSADGSPTSVTLREGRPHSSAMTINVSPGGRWLLASDGVEAFVWDGRSDNPLLTRTAVAGNKVVLSHDDRWLVSSSSLIGDDAILRDLTARGKTVRLPLPNSSRRSTDARAVLFSPDNRWLVTTGAENATARLWDLDDLDLYPTPAYTSLRGNGGAASDAAISADSRWLAISARDEKSVLVWDLKRRARDTPVVFRGSDGNVRQVQFTQDNRWLIGRGDNSMYLWDSRTARGGGVHRGHVR